MGAEAFPNDIDLTGCAVRRVIIPLENPLMAVVSGSTVSLDNTLDNPLDMIEEIVAANEWPFERANHDEIMVEVRGTWCAYQLYFVWQPDFCALQFGCAIKIRVGANHRQAVNNLLAVMNEKMWVGHFLMASDDDAPMFRHTQLLRGQHHASLEQMEDLVEIALMECERFYPAIQYVMITGGNPDDALHAAIIDTVGEA